MRELLVVLGGSISQRTLVDRARARGMQVCVVDGSPTAPELARADVPIVHDFSDTAGVLEQLQAHNLRPLGVASMGADVAVLPVARLANALALPGLPLQVARNATDKLAMQACFAAHDVPTAQGEQVADVAQAGAAFAQLGGRVVIKPVDGSAQRGVSQVFDRRQVAPAFAAAQAASRTGRVTVEEYLDGDEFTVNGFVCDGVYTGVTVNRRVLHDPPPLGVCLAHRNPPAVPEHALRELLTIASDATFALGIDNAPSYAQLRWEPDRGARVIEVGARLGGGKDAELSLLVTGIDLVGAVLDAATGKLTQGSLEAATPAVDRCGQVAFLVRPPGRVLRARTDAALQCEGVQDAAFYFGEGSELPPLRSGADRLGYLIVTAPDEAELDRRTATATAALDLHVEPVPVPAGA